MMARYYTPILILQMFCLFHAYSRKSDFKWYLFILFLPLLGSLIYLYFHFYSRPNVDLATATVKKTINPNYTVEKLIKEAKISDTIGSKLNLADEYYSRNKMEQAMVLYESCVSGFYADDPEINKKLMLAYYENERYEDVVTIGQKLNNIKTFQNSNAKLAYAWSLFYKHDARAAEDIFKELDVQYANHKYRYEYALFLLDTDQKDAARSKLEELIKEADDMESHEKKLKRDVIRMIRAAYKTL